MNARFTAEEIRSFWTEQAVKYNKNPTASWSDVHMIDKEIEEIGARLQDGDRVLDVGCANGYSTTRFALHKNIHIRGIDYIPEMIDSARGRIKEGELYLHRTVEFEVGDITALKEPSNSYNKVIATRVVINLQDWEQQRIALRELARVICPGGTLLLSEATLQGWRKLNKFREDWKLPAIPMPAFNLYLDEDCIVQELSDELQLLEVVNFSSTYYVGTRLLKPLLIKALDLDIDVANPNSEWNRWFASMPSMGDYGTQKLFVFQKK